MLEREDVRLLKIAKELFIRLNPALWPSSYYSHLSVRHMAGMAEGLDHSTLDQRVPGSKPPSDLPRSVRRELASSL